MRREAQSWFSLHNFAALNRVALAIIFLYAGAIKLIHPWYQFAASIADFRVGIPEAWLHPLAVWIPIVEIVLALMLFFPWPRIVTTTSIILMFFLALGVMAEFRGLNVTCGCFGGGMKVGPLWFLAHGGMFVVALSADETILQKSSQLFRRRVANA